MTIEEQARKLAVKHSYPASDIIEFISFTGCTGKNLDNVLLMFSKEAKIKSLKDINILAMTGLLKTDILNSVDGVYSKYPFEKPVIQ